MTVRPAATNLDARAGRTTCALPPVNRHTHDRLPCPTWPCTRQMRSHQTSSSSWMASQKTSTTTTPSAPTVAGSRASQSRLSEGLAPSLGGTRSPKTAQIPQRPRSRNSPCRPPIRPSAGQICLPRENPTAWTFQQPTPCLPTSTSPGHRCSHLRHR